MDDYYVEMYNTEYRLIESILCNVQNPSAVASAVTAEYGIPAALAIRLSKIANAAVDEYKAISNM